MVSEGEASEMEMVEDCKFACRDGKYFIVYQETEQSQMKGSVTTVKTDGNIVWVNRTGPVNTKLCYEVGQVHSAAYHFDFGVIVMETQTQKIEIALGDNGGTINMEYVLDMGGMKTQNQLCISVKRK